MNSTTLHLGVSESMACLPGFLARIHWSPFECSPFSVWTTSGSPSPRVPCHWLLVGLDPGKQWQEIGGLGGEREPGISSSFFFSSLFGVVSPAVAATRTPASVPFSMALTITGFW